MQKVNVENVNVEGKHLQEINVLTSVTHTIMAAMYFTING